MILERTSAALFILFLAALPLERGWAQQRPCASVGAIRWDAWYGNLGEAGRAVEKTLGPVRWHGRTPFCGRITGANSVSMDCGSQEAMDREIGFAQIAGIEYWAFVAYPPDDPMSISLKRYLASHLRNSIRFSLIVRAGRLGDKEHFRGEVQRYIELMKQPTYMKVAGGRPIFFVAFITERLIEKAWGSRAALKAGFDDFRKMAVAAGVGNPYLVVMDFDSGRAKSLLDDLGMDAISSYATHAKGVAAPYRTLDSHVHRYWDTSLETGGAMIPIAMAGWDRRPRVENPVPWERAERNAADSVIESQRYYEQPSPSELAEHLASAVRWVRDHPDGTPANTVLVYAWNENDEGGWLVPTLEGGAARVNAIGSTLRRTCGP